MRSLLSTVAAAGLLAALAGPARGDLRIAELQRLGRAELEGAQPTSVTCVVTFALSWQTQALVVADPDDPNGPAAFVSSAMEERTTGALLAEKGIENGDLLELTALPLPMQLEPGLFAMTAKRIGRVELPPPPLRRVCDLAHGAADNRRTRLRGVVMATETVGGVEVETTLFSLLTPDGEITVRLRGSVPDAWRLRDAEVEFDGIVMPVFNPRAEFLYPELEMFSDSSFRVVAPGGEDPFGVPACADLGVLAWSPEGFDGHARRVLGEVTLVRRDAGYFVLQRGESAVRAFVANGEFPREGDWVEASGFPVCRDDCGALVHVTSRPAERTGSVRPLALALDSPARLEVGGDVNYNDFHFRLVEIRGRVVSAEALGGTRRFVMDVDGVPVTVELPPGVGGWTDVRDRPTVRVKGVLEARLKRNPAVGRYFRFEDLAVHPRTAADIATEADFAWAFRRTVRFGRMLLLAALVPLALCLLAGAVRRHRERIRAQAVKEDRLRIAGELHDTISQHISGAKLWVYSARMAAGEALSAPAAEALTMASSVLEATRLEIRDAIMDLQSDDFVSETPAALVRKIVRASGGNGPVRVRSWLRGLPADLPIRLKRDLLAIVQEAVSNAVRHSGGANVFVVSEGDGRGTFELSVLNDGRGFDAAAAPGPAEGHFGLSNMRERAARSGLTIAFGEFRGYHGVRLERKVR